jgi:hypothetical protein
MMNYFSYSTNIIAFYDNSDPVLSHFYPKYGNKYITITGTCLGLTKTFNALIADTCGNQDCSGCCARNANPTTGFLIDMEYHTVLRNFGTTLCADVHTQLRFTIDLNQPLAIENCGSKVGTCNNPQACCSKDNYCGYGLAFCGAGCQSAYGPCDGPGACGGINGKACAAGQCCSQYGFCGTGAEQCGYACQGDFGSCWAVPSQAPIQGGPLPPNLPIFSAAPVAAPVASPSNKPVIVPTNQPVVVTPVAGPVTPPTVSPTNKPSVKPSPLPTSPPVPATNKPSFLPLTAAPNLVPASALPTIFQFTRAPNNPPTTKEPSFPPISGAPHVPPHPTRSPIVGLPDNPGNSFKPSWPLTGLSLQPSVKVNPFDMNFTAPTSGSSTMLQSSPYSLLLLTFLLLLFLLCN